MRVVKVSEVSGTILNWLVARAEGKRPSLFIFQQTGALAKEHHYSTNWEQGGPIIEREKIGHCWFSDGYSQAHQFDTEDEFNSAFYQTGPTPLIAAMRCYVASKLGETVEVPDELLKSVN